MKVIEIKNLIKEYDDAEVKVKAINGVDLAIEEGEFTVIVGPSGSGKTTLLNLMGGLDKPTGGEININHTSIHDMSDSKLINFRLNNIGFVFQAYNLIPVLTARENIEFIMELQGRPRAERRKRSVELLEAVGLIERINSRPAKLSGGQQQRVAVARALASKPRFILADEPTANLDSASTQNLLDIMEALNHEEKMTFIFSTHDARVVRKAHRVITLEDGKIMSDVMQEHGEKQQ
ncbi:MAG: ABC transporter ATP-binding protein [Bacteroidales bacterium]|nr:ABC transporter ATP-binding protein [Bacteroidales bacterium]